MIIDFDSTYTDTFRQQEDSAFNTHYQTNDYLLLLAVDSFFGCLLGAKLRPDKEYTSKKAEVFLKPILQRYAELDLLVRADLGFTKSEI